MHKMLGEFNNETNELKSNYLVGQNEGIHDVIENALLVNKSQLLLLLFFFFGEYLNEYLQKNYLNQDVITTIINTISITRNYC